jgi:hypothetical protein
MALMWLGGRLLVGQLAWQDSEVRDLENLLELEGSYSAWQIRVLVLLFVNLQSCKDIHPSIKMDEHQHSVLQLT